MLLSKQAQRHLLFNTNCRLWKVSLIVLILESYCLWMEFSQKGISLINSDDPLYSEKGFYMATLQILLGMYSKFFFIFILTKFYIIFSKLLAIYINSTINCYTSKASLQSTQTKEFYLRSV